MRVWRSRDLRLWRGVVPAQLLFPSLLAAGGILAVVAVRRLAKPAPLRFTGACPGGVLSVGCALQGAAVPEMVGCRPLQRWGWGERG